MPVRNRKYVALAETYNFRILVFICVCLDVPDNLVGKELGEFGRFKDISFNIAKNIITQDLDNLRDVEECYVDRMAF
jgi:hypothetical protein